MLSAGFRYHRDMALQVLHRKLDRDEKAELLELLYEASAIDEVEASEVSVLQQAGEALGLSDADVTGLIAGFAAR